MKNIKTFEAKIFVGLKNLESGKTISYPRAEKIIQEYINKIRLCVTLTKTKFVYVGGKEDGIIIGIINYPRFPRSNKELKNITFEFAKFVKREFAQKRLSIMFKNKTYMLD